MNEKEIKNKLLTIIAENVFVTNKDVRIIYGSGLEESQWLMDFRRVILKPDVLDMLSALCIQRAEIDENSQVCGLEVAAIPFVTGVVMKSLFLGKPVNGFFIRKSRKKTGLLNMVEGEIEKGKRIVLVDDILNSGSSFMRQIKVLEELGEKVDTIFCIIRYREESFYEEFHKKGIKVLSLFELNDFKDVLALENFNSIKSKPVAKPYTPEWMFSSPNPSLEHVVPKSTPILHEGVLFFGSDSGNFYALDTKTKEIKWKYLVPFGAKGKTIFSSPVLYKDTVFFGAYDGNFYALDITTGKRKWVNFDADWIGSSPCVAEDLGLICVGMEFGFWGRKGGVAAFDIKTGKTLWQTSSSEVTHGSPAYSKKNKLVACGSNDSVFYMINAKTGDIKWQYTAAGEIKYRPSFSPDEKLVAVTSFGGEVLVFETKTGKLIYRGILLYGGYSTPAWIDNKKFICSSLDKKIYMFDIEKKDPVWTFQTSARIFATPHIYKGHVFCGGNDAIMRVIDIQTGKQKALFQCTERITNEVVIDEKNNCIYVPTYANQIIKISPILPPLQKQ